jgi:ABC-type sugar transport system permease subunit
LGYAEQSRLRSYASADYSDPTGPPERLFVGFENSRMVPDYAYQISLNVIVFLVFVIVLCITIAVAVGIELNRRKY